SRTGSPSARRRPRRCRSRGAAKSPPLVLRSAPSLKCAAPRHQPLATSPRREAQFLAAACSSLTSSRLADSQVMAGRPLTLPFRLENGRRLEQVRPQLLIPTVHIAAQPLERHASVLDFLVPIVR